MILLSFCFIAVIAAETSPKLHYGVKNSLLCLQTGKSPPYKDIRWKFNYTAVIVYDKEVTPNYTTKVELNVSVCSLCIYNLTEKDSGIYEVTIVKPGFTESKETHRLIVQERVLRPVIRMSLRRSNLSGGLCNITVNCSVQDDWVWSVCDEDSCRTSRQSLSVVNITISAVNRSIVCTANNYVSTSNASKIIEATCLKKYYTGQDETPRPIFVIVMVIIIVAVVSLCVLTICLAKRHFSLKEQTSTAALHQNQLVESQPQPVPRVSSTSSSEAEISYENVDTTRPSRTSSPPISPTGQSQAVDTVYSFLQVPKVTTSVAMSDSMEAQDVSTSQSATLGEAEQAPKIDTVYSVLQKPKKMKPQQHQ